MSEKIVFSVVVAFLDGGGQGNDELRFWFPSLVQQHPVCLFHEQHVKLPAIDGQVFFLLGHEVLEAEVVLLLTIDWRPVQHSFNRLQIVSLLLEKLLGRVRDANDLVVELSQHAGEPEQDSRLA